MLSRTLKPAVVSLLIAAAYGNEGRISQLVGAPTNFEASHSSNIFHKQSQQQKETMQISDPIVVTAGAFEQQALNGPVAVSISIVNNSTEPASILLPYPNPNNLSFRCATSEFALPKNVEDAPIERTSPTTIKPRMKYTVIYYLNRYFKLLRPGRGRFRYELTAFVKFGNQGSQTPHTFTGEFDVELVAASDEELRTEFAASSEQLRSADRQVKLQAAESLAFIDSPLVVPYLTGMLRIDNLEVTGIQALGSHPSPESEVAITSMLAHPDSAVVSAALTEIDRMKFPVQRHKIQSLLASQNPNVRWTALKWLVSRPEPTDLPFVQPLVRDSSEAVRKEAAKYVEFLKQRK
jgi:hypothetical protein